MEQALRARHREQRADLPCATRLPVDGDVVRIAAEIRDVVVDPLKCGDGIQHPHVRRLREFRAADLGQVQEPERIQTVVNGYCYYVTFFGKISPVINRVAAVAAGKSAAVQPQHDWEAPAGTQLARPNV